MDWLYFARINLAGVLFAALIGSLCSPASAQSETFGARIAAAAIERTKHQVIYDGSYVVMAYPMGDVAPDRGVCADVVVRALRTLDVDLQQLVHEDMTAAFNAYPNRWGLSRPDSNIDHRRVLNLETFFSRKGAALEASDDPADYAPGDIVAWNLRGGSGLLPHIGIVTGRIAPSGRPMVAHNIGAGPQLEDVLFDWEITGHYRLSEQHFGSAR